MKLSLRRWRSLRRLLTATRWNGLMRHQKSLGPLRDRYPVSNNYGLVENEDVTDLLTLPDLLEIVDFCQETTPRSQQRVGSLKCCVGSHASMNLFGGATYWRMSLTCCLFFEHLIVVTLKCRNVLHSCINTLIFWYPQAHRPSKSLDIHGHTLNMHEPLCHNDQSIMIAKCPTVEMMKKLVLSINLHVSTCWNPRMRR